MNDLLLQLPGLIASHLALVLVALGVSIGVGMPAAVLLVRTPWLRGPALAVAGVMQTIPSLAMLALMVPVLASVHTAAAWIGLDTPVLGFAPAAIALTLYGLLPVLRNGVTGLAEVEPGLVEAAHGLGMSPRQVLMQVELPLAAPVIFAGIRTASVWVVGTATLATPVGQACLGDLIFGGLQTRSWDAVLLGCVAAAGLALVMDGWLAGLEKLHSSKSRLILAAAGVLVLLSVASAPTVAAALSPSKGPKIIVGAKGFTEQYLLSRVLRDRLTNVGYDVQLKEGLGSSIIFDALHEGAVDVYIDYSGTVWSNHMGREDRLPREQVVQGVGDWMQQQERGVCLGSVGFENAYAIVVKRELADKKGLRTLDDLARLSPELDMGADYEFYQRPEWTSLKQAYGLQFRNRRTFDPSFMYDAIDQGDVHAISAFSSDGRIATFDLTVLEDTAGALPPYDAILLVGARASGDAHLLDTLRPLIGAIDVASMREANRLVDSQEMSVEQAAAWLSERSR